MSKYLYAFFQVEGEDHVAICPKEFWDAYASLEGSDVDVDSSDLAAIATELGLCEQEDDGTFMWSKDLALYDVRSAFIAHPDLFEGSEELRSYCAKTFEAWEDDAGKVEQATVPQPEPKPEPAPQPQAPQQTPMLPQRDCMRIQLGNHVVEIPMDVQTAMMLAQTFQAYAQLQIVKGAMQPAPVQQQATVPQPQAPTPTPPEPEKPKSAPSTPTADVFKLPNSMTGEFLDVHGKTVVKIEQGGKLIAETKLCDTRDEAYDIARRFGTMIPGTTKKGEIIRK